MAVVQSVRTVQAEHEVLAVRQGIPLVADAVLHFDVKVPLSPPPSALLPWFGPPPAAEAGAGGWE